MAQWAQTHQPCPCGKSSDAYSIDANDGHGYCFSCGQLFPGSEKKDLSEQFTYEYLSRRNISAETHKFFGVQTQIDAEGKQVSVAYTYPNGARQIRFLDKKDFRWSGTDEQKRSVSSWLAGKFPAGKAITIVEGNDDAMSAWQMLGKYPVYPIRSASTAMHDVRADYDYLNSFEKIYLCLDNDEPGKRATKEIASVFGFGKIYLVDNAPLKDATDYIEAGRDKDFRNLWYNAKRYMPDTVISSFADIRKQLDKTAAAERYPWPFPTWQKMTGGIEVHRQYLVTGLEGTGKTEVLHEVAASLLPEHPDLNIGALLMEEPLKDTIEMQVGKHLKRPVHLTDYELTNDELMQHYEKLVGREDRVHFYRHFGSEDTEVLESNIRFMVVACGCKIILFDNYQLAVTGRTKERDTEALDFLSTRLESLVKELPFALIAISHENDNELTRGSRNISKTCDVWINIKRDVKNENEHLRNIQYTTFNKNRQGQKTGPSGRLIYNVDTATLSELTEELPV